MDSDYYILLLIDKKKRIVIYVSLKIIELGSTFIYSKEHNFIVILRLNLNIFN